MTNRDKNLLKTDQHGLRLAFFAVVGLVLAACGGGGDDPAPAQQQETVEKLLNRASNATCLAPASAVNVATLLSDTGCFTDTATREPASGVMAYTVNNLLWSDGEKKGRYFAIPDGSTIALAVDESAIVATNDIKNGSFVFPAGSVVIKHFFNGARVVETRLLMNHANDGWAGYAYEWNDQQTDATLLTTSKQITTPVSHYFPSPAECMECHTDAANVTLGPDTLQLNYTLNYVDGSSENFLDALDRLQYFSATPLTAYKQARLYALSDSSATLEQRARSYLHSNCSGCHRTGAPQGGYGDMRYNSSFASNVCGVSPSLPDSPGTALIEPGNADSSTVFRRIRSNGMIQMPPIGRATVDQEAVQVIEAWVNSLGACQ